MNMQVFVMKWKVCVFLSSIYCDESITASQLLSLGYCVCGVLNVLDNMGFFWVSSFLPCPKNFPLGGFAPLRCE